MDTGPHRHLMFDLSGSIPEALLEPSLPDPITVELEEDTISGSGGKGQCHLVPQRPRLISTP